MHRILFALVLAALTPLAALAQNTVSFTMSTEINGAGQVEPRLSWSTTPTATSCTASGDWSGTKAPSGEEQQAGTTTSKSYSIQCSWPGNSIVTFSWTNASLNTDGSSYTNQGITRIKYRFAATAPTANDACAAPIVCVDVDDTVTPRPTMRTVTGITEVGTLRAISQHISAQGVPSPASNVASKQFQGNVSVTQTVTLTFPAAPTGFDAT